MFKLIKIVNSGTSAPEITTVLARDGYSYRIGDLLTFKDKNLVRCDSTDKPLFVAVESIDSPRNNQRIRVFAITPDMIFETISTGYPSYLVESHKYTLKTDNNYAEGITTTEEGGVATVVDKYDAAYIGDKVLVRFE